MTRTKVACIINIAISVVIIGLVGYDIIIQNSTIYGNWVIIGLSSWIVLLIAASTSVINHVLAIASSFMRESGTSVYKSSFLFLNEVVLSIILLSSAIADLYAILSVVSVASIIDPSSLSRAKAAASLGIIGAVSHAITAFLVNREHNYVALN